MRETEGGRITSQRTVILVMRDTRQYGLGKLLLLMAAMQRVCLAEGRKPISVTLNYLDDGVRVILTLLLILVSLAGYVVWKVLQLHKKLDDLIRRGHDGLDVPQRLTKMDDQLPHPQSGDATQTKREDQPQTASGSNERYDQVTTDATSQTEAAAKVCFPRRLTITSYGTCYHVDARCEGLRTSTTSRQYKSCD